ncbi:MAG: phosphate transport system regulatory protein PhoU [Phycisphaerales bacterium]|nr:MAG: phosphate transport system regulatory protein PhoU [Phycisphaerales bacterium]
MATFARKLEQLNQQLIAQGNRVVDHTLRAVDSYFESDRAKAEAVIEGDNEIDRIDVEIEQMAVPLLGMGETDAHSIRAVLLVVKANNELERIADCAVDIAEVVVRPGDHDEPVPPTFRVMANSVVGMLRDVNRAMAETNAELAQQVLSFDDAVRQFKSEIMLDAQQKVASGDFPVDFAFRLLTVTKALERIADHCTNISEQVIYLGTGKTVRHLSEGWSKPEPPNVSGT